MAFIPIKGIGTSNGTAAIFMNDANNKITSVQWLVLFGSVKVTIWATKDRQGDPIYQNTFTPGSGSENVPGNWTAVFIDEGGGEGYWDVPFGYLIEVFN